MYAVGTSVFHTGTGVCRVENIGLSPLRRHGAQRYYKLRALFSTSGECIYIPVDTAKSLRPLINRDEATNYLEQLPKLKSRPLAARKYMDLTSHYREMLASGDPKSLLLLIKEIHLKEKEFSAHKKPLGRIDASYLRIAERLVCEEFAVALQAEPESIKERLQSGILQ